MPSLFVKIPFRLGSFSARVILSRSHLAEIARKRTLISTVQNNVARVFNPLSPLWAEIFAYFCLLCSSGTVRKATPRTLSFPLLRVLAAPLMHFARIFRCSTPFLEWKSNFMAHLHLLSISGKCRGRRVPDKRWGQQKPLRKRARDGPSDGQTTRVAPAHSVEGVRNSLGCGRFGQFAFSATSTTDLRCSSAERAVLFWLVPRRFWRPA